VALVPLRSLSPRELSQNLGLRARIRSRSPADLTLGLFVRVQAMRHTHVSDPCAATKNFSSPRTRRFLGRSRSCRFSPAASAELGDLFDRSLHGAPNRFASQSPPTPRPFFAACDRGFAATASTKHPLNRPLLPRVAESAITSPESLGKLFLLRPRSALSPRENSVSKPTLFHIPTPRFAAHVPTQFRLFSH